MSEEDPLRRYLRFDEGNRVRPRDIMTAVEEVLTERYGPPRQRVTPPGLRLEMHPSVRQWLLVSDDELLRHCRNLPDELFAIPVLVTTHLPEGRWRLVIVTEEVILGGTYYVSAPGDKGTGGA